MYDMQTHCAYVGECFFVNLWKGEDSAMQQQHADDSDAMLAW
jgi:hypothetical protein